MAEPWHSPQREPRPDDGPVRAALLSALHLLGIICSVGGLLFLVVPGYRWLAVLVSAGGFGMAWVALRLMGPNTMAAEARSASRDGGGGVQ